MMDLSNLRAALSVALLAVSVPALGHAYARALAVFSVDRRARKVVLGAWLASAVARALAPKWLVTMFIGYLLTEQALELSTASHYGVGSLALYHALFGFLPPDHRWILWTNAVVGVLTLPLAAAVVARLTRQPMTGALFAALLALTPLFIKNDVSEANHVPCLWWAFGGLVALEAFAETGRRANLVAAGVLLTLSASARPEMPLLLSLWVLGFWVMWAPPRERLRDPVLWGVLLGCVTAVAPHVLHVMRATDRLVDGGGLPSHASLGEYALRSLWQLDTVLTPSLFPVGVAALALVGVLSARERWRVRWGLLALAVLSVGLYGVDLCRANMARVHVPGALLVTMLAAVGLAALVERLPQVSARVGLGALVAASAVPTVGHLWAPTNEQAEEELVREAVQRLPASEPYTLVRFAWVDRRAEVPDAAVTHHHFPDYLVRPPRGAARLSSITDWLDAPDFAQPAYFFWGVRCYAELRPAGAAPPPGDGLQPACARLRERFQLEPVFEHDLPNRGDVWLEYYGDAPMLRVGLYRIGARIPSRE